MQIKVQIKVLKGQDVQLEVLETMSVLEIKQEIEKIFKIPCANQKLLLLGRPLNDESASLASCRVRDGSKLILIEKKPDLLQPLMLVVHRSFRRFYNEQQSEKLLQEFMTDFNKKLKLLSYDDIERLAENLLLVEA